MKRKTRVKPVPSSVQKEEAVGFVREIIFRVGSEQIELVQVETQLENVTALAFLQKIPEQDSKEFRLSNYWIK